METTIQTQPKRQTTIREWLSSQTLQAQIASALPSICTKERFMRVIVTAMQRTPKLMQCSQASLFQAFMTCASLGIEPDGRRAHLIPYENRKMRTVECQLIVDYKGLLELVKRSGDVTVAYAEKVCENDKFAWKDGDVSHEIDFRRPRGRAYCYYARAKNKDGSVQCSVMTTDEVSAIRARSRSAEKGPWVTDFDEMAKKTVFRRLTKWLVLSPEASEAIERIDAAEFGGGSLNVEQEPPSRGLAARLAEAEALESANVESESVPAVEEPARIEHNGEDLKDAVRAAIEKDREDALRKSKERAVVEQELIVE